MGVSKVQMADGTVLMTTEGTANVNENTMLTGTNALNENGDLVAGGLVVADISLAETEDGVIISVTNSDGTRQQALIAAGATPVSTVLTATLSASGWSSSAPYTQTLSVSGILAADSPMADISLSATVATAIAQKEAWACVDEITTADGSITAKCMETKPSADMTIRLQVWR